MKKIEQKRKKKEKNWERKTWRKRKKIWETGLEERERMKVRIKERKNLERKKKERTKAKNEK